MKKKYLLVFFIALNITLSSLSACSNDNMGKGNETSKIENEKITIDKKNNLYEIDDEIENINIENNVTEIQNCYTIKNAILYDSASAINGISEQIIDTEIYEGGNLEKPEIITRDEILNGQFLCCDIEIKNIMDITCNISNIGLAYEQDGVCNFLCYPSYFSESKDLDQCFYEYNILPGQTITAQIGWCADAQLLKIKNFDKKNLYLVINYDGDEDVRKIINLGFE